jgi:hypothetical protein
MKFDIDAIFSTYPPPVPSVRETPGTFCVMGIFCDHLMRRKIVNKLSPEAKALICDDANFPIPSTAGPFLVIANPVLGSRQASLLASIITQRNDRGDIVGAKKLLKAALTVKAGEAVVEALDYSEPIEAPIGIRKKRKVKDPTDSAETPELEFDVELFNEPRDSTGTGNKRSRRAGRSSESAWDDFGA